MREKMKKNIEKKMEIKIQVLINWLQLCKIKIVLLISRTDNCQSIHFIHKYKFVFIRFFIWFVCVLVCGLCLFVSFSFIFSRFS